MQVIDVWPEDDACTALDYKGNKRSSCNQPPLLELVYPRCLLAGSIACPLTLTLAGEELNTHQSQTVKVYARHKGRFLGSGSDESFMSSMACATVAMPSPRHTKDISADNVFFSLDAPSSPGLVSFEFDLGGPMSNWKPVSACWHKSDDRQPISLKHHILIHMSLYISSDPCV